MSVQTSYLARPAIGVAGAFADSGDHDVVSGVSSTRKLLSVAIGASNSQVYSITLNGHAYTYTADGSATTGEIALALVAAIEAGTTPVKATGSDTPILLESELDGADGDFTYADSSGTGSLTETVLVAQGVGIPAGVFVCTDERALLDLGGLDFPIRLPRQASDITGNRRLGFTVENFPSEDATTYGAQIEIPVCVYGRMLVAVEHAVVQGGDVYIRYATGTGTQLGAARNDDDSTTAALLPGASFLASAAAGELAVVQYRK